MVLALFDSCLVVIKAYAQEDIVKPPGCIIKDTKKKKKKIQKWSFAFQRISSLELKHGLSLLMLMEIRST